MSPVLPIAGAVILIALLAAGGANAAPSVPGGMPLPPPPPPPPGKPKPIGGGPSPAKPKPVSPSKPAGPTINQADAEESYGNGCQRGAEDGYTDGFAGAANSPRPIDGPSQSVPDAFNGGYNRVYGNAYAAGASDLASGATPSSIVVRTAGLAGGCAAGFDAWLSLYVASTGATVTSASVRSLGRTRRFAIALPVSYRSLGRRF